MSPIEIVNYAIVEVLEEVVNDKDYAGPFAGELVKLVHYLQDTVPSVKQVSTLEEWLHLVAEEKKPKKQKKRKKTNQLLTGSIYQVQILNWFFLLI